MGCPQGVYEIVYHLVYDLSLHFILSRLSGADTASGTFDL